MVFGIYPNYEVPEILEAIYSDSHSSGGSGYGETIIRSYPLDGFPSLRLDSPSMTIGKKINLAASNSQEYIKLNQTTVNSLIHLDWHDNNGNNKARSIQSGRGIAGTFAVFIAPQEKGTGNEADEGAGALIWAKSADGKKDILVTIRTSSMDMNVLVTLARNLPIS